MTEISVFTTEFFEKELAKLNGGKKDIGIIARDGFVVGTVYDDHSIEINNKPFTTGAEYETALQVLRDNGYVVVLKDQIKGKRVGFGTAWMTGK
jgi:hypothetical protein